MITSKTLLQLQSGCISHDLASLTFDRIKVELSCSGKFLRLLHGVADEAYRDFFYLKLYIVFGDGPPCTIMTHGRKVRFNIWSDSEMEEVAICLMLKPNLFGLVWR